MIMGVIRLLHALFPGLHNYDLRPCPLANENKDVILFHKQNICWCGDRRPA